MLSSSCPLADTQTQLTSPPTKVSETSLSETEFCILVFEQLSVHETRLGVA
jgi:hypothetical protein